MISDKALTALRDALASKVRSRTEATSGVARALRECVDRYEEASRAAAEAAALADMTGTEPDPVRKAGPELALKDLILLAGSALGDHGAAPPRHEPPPRPEPPPELAPDPPKADPEGAREDVQRLLNDIRDASVAPPMPHPRAHALLQELVARLRCIQTALPNASSPLSEVLDASVPSLGRLKDTMRVESFVQGLSRDWDRSKNWGKIARSARASVEKWDLESSRSPMAQALQSIRIPHKKVPSPVPPAPFPKLAALSRPVVMVAGSHLSPDRTKTVKARFGLEPEIVRVNRTGAPRVTESLIQRIRGGGIGAVVIVEGVIGHGLYSMVKSACEAAGVPYAHGGSAGVGAVEKALSEMESKLP